MPDVESAAGPLGGAGAGGRPVRVDPSGRDGPTPGHARSARWRRVAPGWVVPATADATDPDQRIREAACRLPSGGAVTGWAALRWSGAAWLNGTASDGGAREVPLLTGGRWCRPAAGIAWSQDRVRPDQAGEIAGVPVVAPAAAAIFAARHAPDLRDAVVALDMSAAADLVSRDELRRGLAAEWPRTGIDQARRATDLMSENSWSPMETRVRLCWVLDAELPAPLVNTPVFDEAGRLVGLPDLLEEAAGLAVEYEGAVHLAAERRHRDLVRGRRFEAVGLPALTVVAGEVSRRASTADLMRAAWDRARRGAGGERRWTTTRPSWWTPTHTVALRRALPASARARAVLPPPPPPATSQRPSPDTG